METGACAAAIAVLVDFASPQPAREDALEQLFGPQHLLAAQPLLRDELQAIFEATAESKTPDTLESKGVFSGLIAHLEADPAACFNASVGKPVAVLRSVRCPMDACMKSVLTLC